MINRPIASDGNSEIDVLLNQGDGVLFSAVDHAGAVSVLHRRCAVPGASAGGGRLRQQRLDRHGRYPLRSAPDARLRQQRAGRHADLRRP